MHPTYSSDLKNLMIWKVMESPSYLQTSFSNKCNQLVSNLNQFSLSFGILNLFPIFYPRLKNHLLLYTFISPMKLKVILFHKSKQLLVSPYSMSSNPCLWLLPELFPKFQNLLDLQTSKSNTVVRNDITSIIRKVVQPLNSLLCF